MIRRDRWQDFTFGNRENNTKNSKNRESEILHGTRSNIFKFPTEVTGTNIRRDHLIDRAKSLLEDSCDPRKVPDQQSRVIFVSCSNDITGDIGSMNRFDEQDGACGLKIEEEFAKIRGPKRMRKRRSLGPDSFKTFPGNKRLRRGKMDSSKEIKKTIVDARKAMRVQPSGRKQG